MVPQAAQTAGVKPAPTWERTYRNCRHILPVEGLVALGIHVLRSGGSLGIDIEHQKAVVAVARRDPFHRFQRIVQVPGTAVEGLIPIQIRGFSPRVPSRYRYSA